MAERLTAHLPDASPARAAADLHPKIEERLEPGERIITAGCTSGGDISILEALLVVVWALVLFGWMFGSIGAELAASLGAAIALMIAAALLTVFIACSVHGVVMSRDKAHYALTDRRLLYLHQSIPGWFRAWAWSLSGRKIVRDMRIRCLMVLGPKDSGRITLRHVTFTSCPPITLTGIGRPLEFASLIKSTLKLDVEIEDYTR